LVYLTKNSIASQIVKKEIDASLIQKFKDNDVAFLPYVSSSSLRDKLRSDLQSLQIPEWNNGNYCELLPRVVSEIWHSFFERTLTNVRNNEKVKRLEAELELKKIKEVNKDKIFTRVENAEFDYICKTLKRRDELDIETEIDNEKKYYKLSFNILNLLFKYIDEGFYFYDWVAFNSLLQKSCLVMLKLDDKKVKLKVNDLPEYKNWFLMLGLIKQGQYLETISRSEQPIEPLAYLKSGTFTFTAQKYFTETKIYWEFTEKAHRLRFWLAYNKISLPEMSLSIVEKVHS
jgi:hypothetical protein